MATVGLQRRLSFSSAKPETASNKMSRRSVGPPDQACNYRRAGATKPNPISQVAAAPPPPPPTSPLICIPDGILPERSPTLQSCNLVRCSSGGGRGPSHAPLSTTENLRGSRAEDKAASGKTDTNNESSRKIRAIRPISHESENASRRLPPTKLHVRGGRR